MNKKPQRIERNLFKRVFGRGSNAPQKAMRLHQQQSGQWQDVFSYIKPIDLRNILQSVAQNSDMTRFLELAEQIEERDTHYRSVLQQRRLAVAGRPSEIAPGDESDMAKRIADDVRAMTERSSPDFHDLKIDLLDAQGKGFALAEIIWGRTANGFSPVAFERVDQRWTVFDQDDGKTLLMRSYGSQMPQHMMRHAGASQGGYGYPLPDKKFIIHMPKTKSGLPARSGLAFSVVSMTLLKSLAVRDWWAYAEVFGLPLRIGKYNESASPEEIRTLVHAISNIASDAGAVFPENMSIEFPSQTTGAQRNELFEKMARWCDEQISKAVVGVTMTADSGSSEAQATVHLEVREDLIVDDHRQLLNTLNSQLIKWYVDLRYGAQEVYPRLIAPIEDNLELPNIQMAINMGLPVGMGWLREWLGIPEPDSDDEILSGAPAGAAMDDDMDDKKMPGKKKKMKMKSGAKDKGEDDESLAALKLDKNFDPDINKKEWAEISADLIAPLKAALETAADPDEFLKMALAAGTPDELANDLALRAFQARVDGEVDR